MRASKLSSQLCIYILVCTHRGNGGCRAVCTRQCDSSTFHLSQLYYVVVDVYAHATEVAYHISHCLALIASVEYNVNISLSLSLSLSLSHTHTHTHTHLQNSMRIVVILVAGLLRGVLHCRECVHGDMPSLRRTDRWTGTTKLSNSTQ